MGSETEIATKFKLSNIETKIAYLKAFANGADVMVGDEQELKLAKHHTQHEIYEIIDILNTYAKTLYRDIVRDGEAKAAAEQKKAVDTALTFNTEAVAKAFKAGVEQGRNESAEYDQAAYTRGVEAGRRQVEDWRRVEQALLGVAKRDIKEGDLVSMDDLKTQATIRVSGNTP